ncbi:MAG: thiamine phosphate synthase [Geminocystis sp.]|nr:thiamine phosphate synthase [Geminocystis sp.]
MERTIRAIYRILDANLNRAREGLRIIEEWCRFGLNNEQLTAQCKDMRQTLAFWHSDSIRAFRDTQNDVGTNITHPQERTREDISSLLQANFCRVQEALRVLEEYGKLVDTGLAQAMKDLRYQVYVLESKLMSQNRKQLLRQCPLYLVTSPVDNLYEVVEAALQGGLKLVQYRSKNEDDYTRWQQASRLRKLCNDYNALFLVNDRVDIALAVDADGVHLGQMDLPVAVARQLLGNERIIGKSTTNPQEMEKAIAEGVDYIGVGPVYATPTKPEKKPAGLSYVRYAKENATVPWFAIGGIDVDNIQEVVAAGASQVAVVRAIMNATDPKKATQQLLNQLLSLDKPV